MSVPVTWQTFILDETDSTNDHAKRLLVSGDVTPPTAILARQQTAGRGRLDRYWMSPEGNLHLTLVMEIRTVPEQRPQLGFVVALALLEALGGVSDLRCKWPNDLLLNGKKIAGMLLEVLPSHPHHVVMGVGVNLQHHPAATEVRFPATSLAAEGIVLPTAETLMETFQTLLPQHIQRWQVQGFAAVREAWLARAWNLGKTIVLSTPKETWQGIFQTIDDTGAMMMKTDAGVQRITVGDVGIG